MVNGKKLLAMFLVFTLTFSHFAIVTESLATTGFVSLFGANSSTENENVEFEAYLSNGEETAKALVSDVNNQELDIGLQLDVKKSGYLKHAKVEIKSEGEKLNFKIKEQNNIANLDHVQALEDNVLEFNKIDSSSDKLEISVPIEYEMEEYISEEKFVSTAQVILSGIYVDDDGEENEISKEVPLKLAWKDERAVRIENEVSKYIQFGSDGVILQTIIKVDSSNENQNSLPTKETELNIDVPKINDIAPTQVTVLANSTAGTNGKGVGEVEFTDENWSYQKEVGTVNIKLENRKQLIEVNEFDEYLKVEGEEIKQEERYYSKAGIDEYIVTYTFQGIERLDEMPTSSKIEAKVVTFSGVEADDKQTITTAERTDDFVLSGQTGNIVSYNVENETPEVSKVYAYLSKEVEYNSKTLVNISYTDLVEGIMIEDVQNDYIDKSGNKTQTDDMYYKQISVTQEEFNHILGEEGNIQILDVAGNGLATINKESAVDENGNYVVYFQDKISKIVIQTSAPINTGNLIITNKKATSNRSISKADYANMEYIATTTVQKAKFSYVSDLVELGNCIVKTKLNDTTTDFRLILDRDNLSTITTNTNVEMRLELNNDKATSDLYGNSVFEIEMPQQVTNINITNASMIYGEGLEISNVETYIKDGKIRIRITVAGNQTDLNSGVLTNGTNIVLNADIDVDQYTSSEETAIKAYCDNSEATNYAKDYEEAKIQYSAPSGVIAINTISNYNNEGSQITSIKQGEQTDYIDVYSEAKVATMEIAMINNNEDTISNLKLLGRIPFEGVKDLTTQEDLGTTVDTKMVSKIVPNESNQGEFSIYYSSEEEATEDLNNASNGWVTDPESLDQVKSYLIVPNDEKDQLEAKQALKFTYEYEVPANLNHNENIYGTFMASYENNSESASMNEIAKPDLVGLTTGVGPELELNLATNVNTVKENDEIQLTTTVKNIGEDIAQNVTMNLPIPANTIFVSAEANKDTVTLEYADGKLVANMENLSKDASVDITVIVKVETVYEEQTISLSAITTAKDLNAELSSNKIEIKFEAAEMSIEQFIDLETEEGYYYKKGEKITDVIYVENLTQEMQENVTVTTTVPKELDFLSAYMVSGSSREGITKIENATYDSSNNTVTWNIGQLQAEEGKSLKLELEVGDLEAGKTANTAEISTQVSAKEIETYQAENIIINVGKSSIEMTLNSSTPTYVTEGDMIHYTFEIKNEGPTMANDVVLTDIIPEGIIVKEVSYSLANVGESVQTMSETEQTNLTLSIPGNSQVDVNVKALAGSLDGAKEKTVTNEGTVTTSGAEKVTSNSVTHIIQAQEKTTNPEDAAINDEEDHTPGYTNPTTTDITKSYKITGVAWLDANENGMRDDGEQRMSNITAMLVDSSNGVIKATTTTNSNGEYSFAGIQNGSYLVLFKYDTTLYTTTTYRKEGIESNINSDVVTTKIEQNGKKENGAVTDVISINGANVSNIDIGLIESAQFSLGIDKAITKVTVQNAQGTVTEEFDKTKLSQYGIAAKYLAGTTVYVEYTMTVTNNGDLAGFASEIVDYIPQGMTFNSNLNPDWYTGTDGNLYTKALANTELVSGQSKEITLVLTKQMTAENTKLVSNTAEIADDFNIYGVSDKNSTPNNKAQGEDDISTADIILTVKTGESLIYISAIIVSAILGCAVAFIVYERVLKNKRKGGV